MKALVFKGKDLPWGVTDFPKPKPVKDQVLVKLKAAAINHRDLWATLEQTSVLHKDGVVLGSDGCGVVEDVGEDADPFLVGMEVVINPSLEWGKNPAVQGDTFRILGNPDHGTMAEYIVISKKIFLKSPSICRSSNRLRCHCQGSLRIVRCFRKQDCVRKRKC
jgi:NADPH:quinone reductase-like Zn-dependent oxidoreductase